MKKKTWLALLFVLWALPAWAELIVDTAWVRRYNGPGDYDDVAEALAVDDAGNVYVTGYSWSGPWTAEDYATIKYDQQGSELWVATYNGPGSSEDWPFALALDDSGNVCVTGRSIGSETSWDYATIKYDSSGNELWVSRYAGPARHWDIATHIAVDDSGNVHVTGSSKGGGTDLLDYDYATIKYDPDGTELWVRRYNGPSDLLDCPRGLALDENGNVFVTGVSWDSVTNGVLWQSDCATVKYDASGNQLWIQRYNALGDGIDEGRAMAIDGSGNVYVTGCSDGSGTWWDYATIKYDSWGNQLWVRRYTGLGEFADDVPCAIALDASNDVNVTGYSRHNWCVPYNGDYATVKYDSSGNQLWARRYEGTLELDDEARAMAVGSSGSVYVTGRVDYSYDSGVLGDYGTVGYDSEGNELWFQRYNGGAEGFDEAKAIAADDFGNVYVTGYSMDDNTHKDWVTIKYVQALRGDAARDGAIDIQDVIYIIAYLYENGSAPQPLEVGNVNCDETMDVCDVVYLINYVLKDGPSPDC